jgi:hypothetical protein
MLRCNLEILTAELIDMNLRNSILSLSWSEWQNLSAKTESA